MTTSRPREQSPPALGNVCEEESKGGRNQGDLGLGRPKRRLPLLEVGCLSQSHQGVL